jgi:hypothetical protein
VYIRRRPIEKRFYICFNLAAKNIFTDIIFIIIFLNKIVLLMHCAESINVLFSYTSFISDIMPTICTLIATNLGPKYTE